MIGRRYFFAVAATCLVAAVTYAGAVSTRALLEFVLPGVVIAALVASRMATQRRLGAAVVVGAGLVLGWSELANILTGTSNGPAARSTFTAAVCSLLSIVAAASAWPASFLVPVTGSVFGALALGAGGEVQVVAVAAAVCALATLAWIERSRHNWTAQPRQGAALLVLSLGVGAAAAGAAVLQTQNDSRAPLILARAQADPRIKPAWADPLPHRSKPHLQRAHSRPVSGHRAAPAPQPLPAAGPTSRSHVWLIALAGIGLLVLAVLVAAGGRAVAARLAWRRLRRRLASGTPVSQVAGAWVWARMRLEACQLPLPAELSPDVLLADTPADDLPPDVSTPLRALAKTVTSTAFAAQRPVNPAEVVAAWTSAGRAEVSARQSLTRRGRLALALRGPAPTR